MRKIIQILSIIILVAIFIALMLPFIFRGKIDDMIRNEGNKLLNAEFNFKTLDISVFRKFPMISVTMEDFWIKGIDDFANDTLVKADELTAGVNLFSFLGKNGYEITNVQLNNSEFRAIVLANGKANWNILKPDTATITTHKEKNSSDNDSTLHIALDQFVIKNMNVIYDNRQNELYASMNNFNLQCSGDFSSDQTIINLQGGASFINLKSKGVPYLSNVTLSTELFLDADFVTQKYILKENKVCLNAITTSFGGWFTLGDSVKSMDLHLATNQISFKELISLIPGIYTTDFDQLQTSGTAKLTAFAKGELKGDSIVPNFNIALSVENGMFQYPSLPSGIDEINIEATINNPGGKLSQTTVNVDPFDFRLAGNPFSLAASIMVPKDVPIFYVQANGSLNLAMLNEVFPLEAIQLNGLLQTDIGIEGKLSYIQKEQYDLIKAKGHILVDKLEVATSSIPNIKIAKAIFTFTHDKLNLSETNIIVGNSDLKLNSSFENYLGYILKDGMLKGTLNIQSNKLDLNDFMTELTDTTLIAPYSELGEEPGSTKKVPTLLLIPQNIDFKMNTSLKEVLVKDMMLKHINGELTIKDSKANMNNLSFESLGGTLAMNGYYSTANPKAPELKGALQMNHIEFITAYKELDMVKELVPLFENLKGSFWGSMHIETTFDVEMNPILNTMQAKGNLSTKDLSLSGIKTVDEIVNAVENPKLKEWKVKDINVDFTIKDGRLITEPFDLKLGNYNINLSGSTGLDQTIDYKGEIRLPHSTTNHSSSNVINLNIKGTFSSPKVSVDTQSIIKQAATSLGDKALQELGKKMNLDSTTLSNSDSLKNKVKEKAVEKALDFLKKL